MDNPLLLCFSLQGENHSLPPMDNCAVYVACYFYFGFCLLTFVKNKLEIPFPNRPQYSYLLPPPSSLFCIYTNGMYPPCTSPRTLKHRVLRSFIKTGLLRYTDMKQAPERFFAAHRLLASRILGGYGIRFTVQFNLFAGSILGLGGPEQIAMLDQLQKRGDLGW